VSGGRRKLFKFHRPSRSEISLPAEDLFNLRVLLRVGLSKTGLPRVLTTMSMMNPHLRDLVKRLERLARTEYGEPTYVAGHSPDSCHESA
jgi:hypothetical protein